ncbi:RCC1 repeat-containing protein [Candidatus Falkowbacteria bacterium]|nr:RCC1 repeat-containing protein [Candidatus Falkowbacteria bacterium]
MSSLVTNLLFGGKLPSRASTLGWWQSSWSGGVSALLADHANNRVGWDKFFSKDNNVNVSGDGSVLSLGVSSSTAVFDSAKDFLGGTKFGTIIGQSNFLSKISLKNNVAQISSGLGHTLILKNDGNLLALGNNSNGQVGDNSLSSRFFLVPVIGLSGVTKIAAGQYHSLALKSDGTVWAWGYNANGEVGDNTTADKLVPAQVLNTAGNGPLSDVVDIAAGYNFSLALKSDGTVWAWGYNANGRLGDNTVTDRKTPVQVLGVLGSSTLSNIIAIAAGQDHSLALKSDGTVWAWGYNANGRLGDNTATDRKTPVQVLGLGGSGLLTGVLKISAGYMHSLALKSDGTVWAWGYNGNGRLGDNTTTERRTPVQVLGVGGSGVLTNAVSIAAGSGHSIALISGGTVTAWGSNGNGRLGDKTTTERAAPVQTIDSIGTGQLGNVANVFAGEACTFAIKNDGTAWGWGYNSSGRLNDNTNFDRTLPVQMVGFGGSTYLSGTANVYAGGSFSLVKNSGGLIYGWGYNGYGQIGDNMSVTPRLPIQSLGPLGTTSPSGFITFSAFDHTLAIRNDTTVWAWGYNEYGSLGDKSLTTRYLPVQVSGINGVGNLSGAISVAAGARHSLAVLSDGSIAAWGFNNLGQLGDNSIVDKKNPVQVLDYSGTSTFAGAASVAAGSRHSLALKSDGTVWAWGLNSSGQLGDNTFTDKALPVQVVGLNGVGFLNGVSYVSSRNTHSLALKSDGTVWAWGYNGSGQLGDNTSSNRKTPVQVIGFGGVGFLSGIIAVSAGNSHSLALKSDGTVWAWGGNWVGQLGDGTMSGRYTPVQVAGLSNIVAISAGGDHSLALKSDGTVWAWGVNSSGQLGDNTFVPHYAPVQVKNWLLPDDYLYLGNYYVATGTYVSSVADLGKVAHQFLFPSLTAVLPTSSSATIDLRAGNTPTPDNTWQEWQLNKAGTDISILNSSRYVQ